MKAMTRWTAAAAAVGLMSLMGTAADAACSFTTVGTTMFLDGDCTTDTTIVIPDGVTLNGDGFAITAVDPGGGHFVGGVVENGGSTAHVTNLMINTDNLTNVCDAGANRLRGILFAGASGTITHNTILNVNQGASGCQEGNAVEVRNAPFDGTHPGTETVEIAHNVLDAYQKSGIVCNGDADCWIHHNIVGASATQNNLAANAVQFGFGALGIAEHNHIAGNQWLGASNFVATAVLLFCADGAEASQNNIGGNADVGIFGIHPSFCSFAGSGVTANNNRIFESGDDGPHGDFGLFDFGSGNSFTNNKVRGYDTPAGASPDDGEVTGTKVVPSPQDPGAACFLPDQSAEMC